MLARPLSDDHVTAIYRAAWRVRATHRPHQRAERARAIFMLGLECRAAFNATEDFEPLLLALVDGLTPEERRRLPF